MKLLPILLSGVVAIAMLGGAATRAADTAAPAEKKQEVCPIMGGAINKKLFVDYQGKRIYVCCRACIEKVKANPEESLKKLAAAGVTPATAPVTAPATAEK